MSSPPYELASCPACGSDDAHELADHDALERETEALWAFHMHRLRPGTAVDDLYDRVVFSQGMPLQVVRCNRCGTVYRNPAERGRELVRLYASESLETEMLSKLREAQLPFYREATRRLTRVCGGSGRVLEVGSYVGGFLQAAQEGGWGVAGVDVNEAACEFARARGADVLTGQIEDWAVQRDPDAAFDAIAVWNCFDQEPRPERLLAAAGRLLRKGGTLALRVPNGAFYARLRDGWGGRGRRTARALLAQNNLLAFPYRHGYTTAALSSLVRAHGFEVAHLRGDTLVNTANGETRRWASAEERVLKGVMRLGLSAARAPWFELYARRV